MFGTVLTLVIGLMHLYLFWRIRLLRTGAVLLVLFVLGRIFRRVLPAPFDVPLGYFTMNWMGIVFLLFSLFLIVDLLTGFGRFVPSRFRSQVRHGALAAGLALVGLAFFQGLRPPAVINHQVTLPHLPKELSGTVIVAVSDVHLGPFLGERWLAKRVRDIQAQNPDLVVFLGDVIDGRGGRPHEWPPVMRQLKAPLGVWGVVGNHERGDYGAKIMSDGGMRLLRGASAEAAPGLVLAGVDWPRGTPAENEQALVNALDKKPAGAAIFLTHEPTNAERAAKNGFGLMLAGHTHGGQVWPFNYLVRTRYKFVYGRYQEGPMTVIVTRGIGTWGPRMRLWRRGELVRIILKAGEGGIRTPGAR